MHSSVKISEKKINELLGGRASVRVFDQVGSTNTLLKTAAEAGAPHGAVIVAREQTAGRGRMGRSFHSPLGTGLYVSILVRPELAAENVLLITPLSAVALCSALERHGCLGTQIKWVNDIYVDDKKAAGILVEGAVTSDGRIDYAVVGIGVNLYSPDGGFPDEISATACGAFDGNDRAIDCDRLVSDIIDEFLSLFEKLPEREFMSEYRRRSYLLGKPVTVTRGDGIYFGVAAEVDDSARLVVDCDDGVRRVFDSGEARARAKK